MSHHLSSESHATPSDIALPAPTNDPMAAVRGLDRARWMTQFGDAIRHVAVTEVALVGAHDAGTHRITPTDPGEYAADAPEALVNINSALQPAAHRLAAQWARTQAHSIRAMLQLGVRYFDLRISPRGPTRELWVTHGLFSMPLSAVVEDVAHFYGGVQPANVERRLAAPAEGEVLEYPQLETNLDVVVLDVQRLSGVQTGFGSAKLHQEFFRQLEPLRPLLLKDGQSQSTPLGQLWAAGTRVIVLYPDHMACAVHRPSVIPRDAAHIRSVWFNRNSANELLRHLREELMTRRNQRLTDAVMQGAAEGAEASSPSPSPGDNAASPGDSATYGPASVGEGGSSAFGSPVGSGDFGAAMGNQAALTPTASRTMEVLGGSPRGADGAAREDRRAQPLHILQAILTPTAADFARMLVSPSPGTARRVEDFAKLINSRAITLWTSHKPVEIPPPSSSSDVSPSSSAASTATAAADGRNVLMIDFFTEGRCEKTGLDAVQACHFVNVQRFGVPAGAQPAISRSSSLVCPSRIRGNSDAVAPTPSVPQDILALTRVASVGGMSDATTVSSSVPNAGSASVTPSTTRADAVLERHVEHPSRDPTDTPVDVHESHVRAASSPAPAADGGEQLQPHHPRPSPPAPRRGSTPAVAPKGDAAADTTPTARLSRPMQ